MPRTKRPDDTPTRTMRTQSKVPNQSNIPQSVEVTTRTYRTTHSESNMEEVERPFHPEFSYSKEDLITQTYFELKEKLEKENKEEDLTPPVKPRRTRAPEVHIPGFVKHPPEDCGVTQMERHKIMCVDVLCCHLYCMRFCQAYQNYLNESGRIK